MPWAESMKAVVLSHHNMSRHLCFALLLLIVICCTCGPVYADNTLNQTKRVDLFVGMETRVPEKVGDVTLGNDLKYFSSPFLLNVDGLMVAFAEADYTPDCHKRIDIAARYIETEGMDWGGRATESNGSNWNTQLAMQKGEGVDYVSHLSRPMAVAKGNKIYLLALNHNKSKGVTDSAKNSGWELELAVGEVKPTTDVQGSKRIEWQNSHPLSLALSQNIRDHSINTFPYAVSAFLMDDEKIVFVVRAGKEKGKGEKDNYAIIHLNDTGKEIEVDWSFVESEEICDPPAFFGWEGKIIMVSTTCRGPTYMSGIHKGMSHRVQESIDMGKTWKDAVGPIARIWDNLKEKGDVTTATIGNKTVLLFTQSTDTHNDFVVTHEIYLRFAEGHRVHEFGPIVADDDNHVTDSGLVYTNGELFSLHLEWLSGPRNIFLLRLKDELEGIKSVLKTWDENDEYASQVCKKSAPKGASPGTVCVASTTTNSPVAFLSDKGNATLWQDEYLFMNATVRGGIKVKNGFTFNEVGSGAKWSLGRQGSSQRYNFSKYGLTVMATVTINEVPRGDIPLLTLGGLNNDEYPGLWYDKYEQWKINAANNYVMFGSNWKKGKTYHVMLMVKDNLFSVYIDGYLLEGSLKLPAPPGGLFEIEHLFIGGYPGVAGYVTITDVLLYNQVFDDPWFEITNEKVVETPKQTNPKKESPKQTNPKKESPKQKVSKKKSQKPTDSVEISPKPTNPGDSSVHLSVGSTVFFLSSLWGLTALC